jgi:MoxR-like ATPase
MQPNTVSTPTHHHLSFKQTEALLRALGNGRIGFDWKKNSLADLRRFIDAWIAQGAFAADYVEALAQEIERQTSVPPAPVASAPIPAAPAPAAVPAAPVPTPAPVAPLTPATATFDAAALAAKLRALTSTPEVQQAFAPENTAPAVPAPDENYATAAWKAYEQTQAPAVPAPVFPTAAPEVQAPVIAPVAAVPAPVVTPSVTQPQAQPTPHAQHIANPQAHPERVRARSLFEDQPDVAQALPEDLQVMVYHHPDAPAVDSLYRFNPLHVLVSLAAASCTPCFPVWCGGPRGTGKSEFARQMAARLGRPLFRVNFNKSTEPAEVMGDIGLADGDTHWVDGPVAAALRTAGAVLMLDEITYASNGNSAVLNPVLEAGGAPIRLPRTGEVLTMAPDVMTFAGDNTFGHGDTSGEYASRNVMGSDTLDRFRFKLRFDYLPEAQEVAVLRGHTLRACGRKLSATAAKNVIALIRVAREKSSRGELSGAPSLRGAVAFAIALSCGVDAPAAYETTIVRNAPDESHEELRQIFAAHWPVDAMAASFFSPVGA